MWPVGAVLGGAGRLLRRGSAADLYLLRTVLHDWDDDQAIAILRNCRSAATGGGRALVVGTVIGEIGKPDLATLSDMDMLCVTEASSGTWPSSTDCRRIRMAPRRGLSRRGRLLRPGTRRSPTDVRRGGCAARRTRTDESCHR